MDEHKNDLTGVVDAGAAAPVGSSFRECGAVAVRVEGPDGVGTFIINTRTMPVLLPTRRVARHHRRSILSITDLAG
ncbi:hypothetical protein, partial [Phytoactinopolyspora endophytica]|uniref:hypothetical protein n=1 Tax=Phytoactinopolyspora endophytica TaxID=1642495 RepID=UPI00197B9645